MNVINRIFKLLLGVVTLISVALAAMVRLSWRKLSKWWKCRPKWLRLSLVSVFVIVVAGCIVKAGYSFYKDNYGRVYWDRDLSERVEMHSFADGYWRLYNTDTEQYTTPKVDWVEDSDEDDGYTVYAQSGRRGYVDVSTGEIVIDAEANNYSKAWVFSEGLAGVIKDGKAGFINSRNEVVIPFEYDYCDKGLFETSLLFHDGYCVMSNARGDWGLIDTRGYWVVEPMYDQVWIPCVNGYRVVVDDGKFGVLDSNLNVKYPVEYGFVSIDSDGFILVRDGVCWREDFEGNVVTPFMFDDATNLQYVSGCNDAGEYVYTISDFMCYEVLNSYGIMNRVTGEPVTRAIYDHIEMIAPTLFMVEDNDCSTYYLIDTEGNIVE
ncbi:MAG: WG repeat-containing protein [Bacteroidales bacterium]|nr:WG repeat-containing protein [Bacteroidales bacterium]